MALSFSFNWKSMGRSPANSRRGTGLPQGSRVKPGYLPARGRQALLIPRPCAVPALESGPTHGQRCALACPRDCTPSASSLVRRRFAPLLVGKPFPVRKNDPTPFVARRSTSVLNELRDGYRHRRVSGRPRNTRAGLCPEILTRSFFFLMKRQKKSRCGFRFLPCVAQKRRPDPRRHTRLSTQD